MIAENLLLSWGATYRTLEKNEFLFNEGMECNFYHQLVDGQLKWFNVSDAGKEYLQRIINPGESLAEMPLFDGGPFASSAIALQKSTVIRVPKNIFQEQILNHPELLFEMAKRLSEHLRFKFFLLKEITACEPEKLILSLLNYLKNSHLYVEDENHLVQLTRQQIADITGLRVETVIRSIRHLHEAGELKIENRKVFLA